MDPLSLMVLLTIWSIFTYAVGLMIGRVIGMSSARREMARIILNNAMEISTVDFTKPRGRHVRHSKK